MLALDFWKAVTLDRTDFLERLIHLFESAHVRFCVVGGIAVKYAEPMVTFDLASLARPEVRPVQRAIVHSLRDMAAVDAILPGQIGDRTRDFQDAIVSTRRKS